VDSEEEEQTRMMIRRRKEKEKTSWLMKTIREEVESANFKGRPKVLVDGFYRFGAIINIPWLHTASSKLKLLPASLSSTSISILT